MGRIENIGVSFEQGFDGSLDHVSLALEKFEGGYHVADFLGDRDSAEIRQDVQTERFHPAAKFRSYHRPRQGTGG